MSEPAGGGVLVCADVGSTYTKAALVGAADGALLGAGQHPTTVGTDVLEGLRAAVVAAAGAAGVPVPAERRDAWLVCSSAGGGLRLAVVGFEELVTARAGAAVGLSAGARLVHVAAGALDRAGVAALRDSRPDVVLLVGGTDGGDGDVVRHNAAALGRARLRVPVVAAGNAEARPDVVRALEAGRGPVVATANVLPRLGVLNPDPARAAIREVFLRHVIGGKGLSRGPRFASMVRGPTPDVVLAGVEVLAGRLGGDLLVVDVGGATTDVYSVLEADAARHAEAARTAVAGVPWRHRTVEADLGMRSGADGVLRAGLAERLLDPGAVDGLAAAAARRVATPGLLPGDVAEWALEARLAGLAATVAVRRHARGRDLGKARLVVGSGGVLRHAGTRRAAQVLGVPLADHAGGWSVPRAARVVVDVDYVLAPAGLLAGAGYREAAAGVLGRLLSVPLISQ